MSNLEPYRMADGRCFTDYRSTHETDNELKKVICAQNNACCKKNDHYNYKLCVVKNAENLRHYLNDGKFKNNYLLN